MENRSAAIRLLQTGCGAIPPQFSRSKCGGCRPFSTAGPVQLRSRPGGVEPSETGLRILSVTYGSMRVATIYFTPECDGRVRDPFPAGRPRLIQVNAVLRMKEGATIFRGLSCDNRNLPYILIAVRNAAALELGETQLGVNKTYSACILCDRRRAARGECLLRERPSA